MKIPKLNKLLAAGAMFMLMICGVLAAAENRQADNLELSALMLQTQVLQISSHMKEVKDEKELEAALEELKILGSEGLRVLSELQIKNTSTNKDPEFSLTLYESRVNTLIASAIAGFRFALTDKNRPQTQIKAAAAITELNQKLLLSVHAYSEQARGGNARMRREAILHLRELTPIFVVMDSLTQKLSHINPEVRASALESFALFNRILSLYRETYDFISQRADSKTDKALELNLSLLSPYLRAIIPGLKNALSSEVAPVHESALKALNQIEALKSL